MFKIHSKISAFSNKPDGSGCVKMEINSLLVYQSRKFVDRYHSPLMAAPMGNSPSFQLCLTKTVKRAILFINTLIRTLKSGNNPGFGSVPKSGQLFLVSRPTPLLDFMNIHPSQRFELILFNDWKRPVSPR